MQISVPQSISYDSGVARLIDQRRLPAELRYIETADYREIVDAILSLAVRGAPAIGIAGAYATALAVRETLTLADSNRRAFLAGALDEIECARPTAVNLSWAIKRIRNSLGQLSVINEETVRRCENEAKHIAEEDRAMCAQIGERGAELIKHGSSILTICNTGALATGGIGTALGAIYTAHEQGKGPKVYSCETRPALQGSRLTVWELERAGVDVTLIVDSVAGTLLRRDEIDLTLVGADRIAANGDTANKIGTYTLAVLAAAHHVPFYVAAPSSTFDSATPELNEEHIELRSPDEVRRGFGALTAPENCKVYSPAFDITPRRLISGYISEEGIERGGRSD